jgi:hypothetical protein
MSVQAAFNPAYGTGVTVAPTSTSASSTIGVGSKALVFTNLSASVPVYIRVGTGATSATTADYPVLPSTQVTISKAQDENTVAYITASSTGSIHIMAGEGY